MPTQEQMRKERFEEIFNYVKDANIQTIDAVLYKIRMMYPWMREFTVKEYAVSVMRVLEAQRKEIEDGNG